MIEKNGFFVYCIPPIDGFCGARLFEDVVSEEVAALLDNDLCTSMFHTKLRVTSVALAAIEALKCHPNWNSSVRDGTRKGYDGLRVFALPDCVETSIGFFVKMNNNGTTFVASPRPLPHLLKDDF